MKFLRLLMLTVMTAATLVMLPMAAANADYGCPGTRDVWRPFNDSAGRLAAVAQAYDTADGVCVNLVSKGIYNGRSKFMSVKVCNSSRLACKTDSGTFATYAGPVYYSDFCVWARVKMGDGNGGTIMDLWVPFGCD